MVYADLTKGRFSEVGRAYSLTIVTENRIPHFHDFTHARCVIKQMQSMHDSELLHSLAWVLMPDHLHWLVTVDSSGLSEVVRIFKGKTGFILNKHLTRQGAFWQRGFYDHAIRKEEEIRAAARYIVANPLRAGLVEQISDYPHWDAIWLVD